MKKSSAAVENPSAFKHWIGKALLERMAKSIVRVHPAFDRRRFLAIAPELEALELKPRVRRVRDALRELLPEAYPRALSILLKSLSDDALDGFDLWPMTEFVQAYGLDHPDLSLRALEEMTRKFTGEFAVRPFLKHDPKRTLAFLLKGASSDDVHVRRWASEGTRPRLPWGERLDAFVADPRATSPILEKLKHDPELYVRKSVSNHLNDIAKDHPEFVVETLKRWQKAAGEKHAAKIEWTIHRALRTLIKAGHPGALKLVGAERGAKVDVRGFRVDRARYRMGDRVEFSFEVRSQAKKSQRLVIDYIVHYVKSNGGTAPKVFKLKSLELAAGGSIALKKAHVLRPVTTRRHYPGEHAIEIQINGVSAGRASWGLSV